MLYYKEPWLQVVFAFSFNALNLIQLDVIMKRVILALTILGTAVSVNAQAFIVYDNMAAPSTVSTGTSDALTSATWGDQVTLLQGGQLDSFGFSIFNSTTGGNTGNLLTANVEIRFYDLTGGAYTGGANTKPLIGGFNGTVNFGTGLNAGFFSAINFTGLSGFGINLPQNVLITQRVASFTGTTNRLGVVTYTTDNVGTSIGNNWYLKNATTEGLFAFGGTTSNKIAYSVGLAPEPGSMAVLGLGIAALVRRRAKKSA